MKLVKSEGLVLQKYQNCGFKLKKDKDSVPKLYRLYRNCTNLLAKPALQERQQHRIGSSFYHQVAAPNQLPVSTTSSSTKSAYSFYHQAAPPHQSASSKALSQSAVTSTSLPHPHHGSQVCCCLDIL